jgi:hypothetical protein
MQEIKKYLNFNNVWRFLGLLPLIFIIIYFLNLPSRKETCLEHTIKIKNREFKGILKEKYIDKKQHFSKVLKVTSSSENDILVLTFDKSGLFDYLQINDSIIKESGSLELEIFRNDLADTGFIIDFGCNDL